MEVLNKVVNGLERRYSVLVSIEELNAAMESRLKEAARKIRLDGFRPGKVPPDVVKRMYSDQLWIESKNQAIEKVSSKIIEDENAVILRDYRADIVKDDENGVEFSLKFEVMPTFELKEISDFEFKKYVVKITDDEINEVLETLRKENKKWIEDKDSKEITKGQKVIVDLESRTTVKKLKNNRINDFGIIIEDSGVEVDFWESLVGARVGETKEVSAPKVAGKSEKYKATIKKVFNPVEYEFDDEFAKAIGYEDFEKLKTEAVSRIALKYEYMSRNIMRRDILEKMAELYDFIVPSNMVDIENEEIVRKIKVEVEKLGKEFTSHIQDECYKIAEKRVCLGFVISEIAQKEKIYVSKNEVTQAIKNIADLHPGREREVWKAYTHDKTVSAVANLILENKVVDFLCSKVKTKEIECSSAELVAIDEEPFDFLKDDWESKLKKFSKKSKRESKSKEQ